MRRSRAAVLAASLVTAWGAVGIPARAELPAPPAVASAGMPLSAAGAVLTEQADVPSRHSTSPVAAPMVDLGRARATARRHAALSPAAASRACPDANLMPAPSNLSRVEAATLCLINEQRGRAGLAPLSDQPALAQAARAHSQDMIARGYFDHVSPGGGSLLSRLFAVGYLHRGVSYSVGENIAWGTARAGTPASAVDLWMHSAGHRANILRAQYRQSGIGIIPSVPTRSVARRGATYTEDFGTRR